MGGNFSQELIDRVREAVDIVEIISEYVPLKRAGRSFRALCPFHEEKTPSFHVNPEKQIFHCFGCHQGGNVFTFLMAHERITFPEAVKTLAERAGVEIEESVLDARSAEDKGELRRLNLAACRNYQKWLSSAGAEAARDFLKQRKISPETAEEFKLGYSPSAGTALLDLAKAKGTPPEKLQKAGLVSAVGSGGPSDFFRGRLMFPITDVRGNVVGFGGRALGEATPKYLNTPETPLFSKRRCLFGLDKARADMLKSRHVIVVEGYTDCIMAHQHGIRNVVATLGTALTPEHVRALRGYVDQITVLYDGDEAGLKAAERALELLLAEEVETRVAILPAGEDPCSFLMSHSAQEFSGIIADAKELIEFKLAMIKADPEYQTLSGQARMIDRMMELIAACPNPNTRDLLIKRAAEGLGANRISLTRLCARKQRERRSQSPSGDVQLPDKRTAAERELVGALLAEPSLVEEALEEGIPEECFASPACWEIFQAVASAYQQTDECQMKEVLSRIRSLEAQRLAVQLEQVENEKGRQKARFREALGRLKSCLFSAKARALRGKLSDPEIAKEWFELQRKIRCRAASSSPGADHSAS